MNKKLLLLSSLLLATSPLVSCNSGKVKLTLNSGIGTFADGSTTKVLMVDKGTSFSSLEIEAPTYEGYATYTWEDSNGNLITATSEDYRVYVELQLAANFFEDVSAMRGISTGIVAKTLMEAIARQPDAEDELKENFSICVNAMMMTNNSRDVMAIGDVGDTLMDSIARQPEASGNLQNVSMYCYERIVKLATKDGRCEAMGRIGSNAMEAIARQPESTSKIFETLRIAYTGVEVTANAAKAYAIGDAGASALEAIARSPEQWSMIMDALCLAIEYINNN